MDMGHQAVYNLHLASSLLKIRVSKDLPFPIKKGPGKGESSKQKLFDNGFNKSTYPNNHFTMPIHSVMSSHRFSRKT